MTSLYQLIKFVIVGFGVNGLLYIGYLIANYYGLPFKIAMTLFYILGVLIGFYFNKSWSFSHKGDHQKTFIKYILLYLFGYILNYAALYFFVDIKGYPHQIVQGIMILTLAMMFFILQKFVIFTQTPLSHHNTLEEK